jgi:hypothetical protein
LVSVRAVALDSARASASPNRMGMLVVAAGRWPCRWTLVRCAMRTDADGRAVVEDFVKQRISFERGAAEDVHVVEFDKRARTCA